MAGAACSGYSSVLTQMIVKAQTSPDYPVDVANSKGKCPFTAEASKFSECLQPQANVTALDANALRLPWSSFVGGVPEPEVDPAQLLGFELQFQCQAAAGDCALDVRIGALRFITPAAL